MLSAPCSAPPALVSLLSNMFDDVTSLCSSQTLPLALSLLPPVFSKVLFSVLTCIPYT
jgi:hypothetical protein